jgi:hypothetical protein
MIVFQNRVLLPCLSQRWTSLLKIEIYTFAMTYEIIVLILAKLG